MRCHIEGTSTRPRSEGRPTPATSLTSSRLCHTADEWQMRLDCAQLENDFLRKRLQQCEERLDSEMKARTELEQKVREGGRSGHNGLRKPTSSPCHCERPLCCPALGKENLYCWNKSCPCGIGGGRSEGRVVAQLPSVQTRVTGLGRNH